MNIRKIICMLFISLCLSIGIINTSRAAVKNTQIILIPKDKIEDYSLVDFGKVFQPQFQSFMEKYLEDRNSDFKFVDYKGLMRINTKDGIKYARTYQLRINELTFKSLVNYAASDAVQNKELISFMRQFMLSCVEVSGIEDDEEAKKIIEKTFDEMASDPQGSIKQIKVLMDTISDLRVIGDKGIDISYNICDGYIISESGVVDIKFDLHKFIETINKLNSNKISNSEDIKDIIGSELKYNTENYNINSDTKIGIPKLTKNNYFNYIDLIKLENNKN